jgi:hypothetical protein
VTAGAVWNSHKEAVTNHESRLQHVEKKMEDFASIKTDVAVIKALLERIERRQRYPNSNSPESFASANNDSPTGGVLRAGVETELRGDELKLVLQAEDQKVFGLDVLCDLLRYHVGRGERNVHG